MASSLLSLFIFYIFFFVIIRGVRKRSKGSEVKPNTPAKSAQQSAEVFRNSQPVQSRPATTSRPAATSYPSHSAVSNTSQAKKPVPAQSDPSKHSTMGYLHEKAKQDEEEHRKEDTENATAFRWTDSRQAAFAG